MQKGLFHIYTGPGKGKTTAAVGLGSRASGQGLKVLMIQFLKGQSTGEMETSPKELISFRTECSFLIKEPSGKRRVSKKRVKKKGNPLATTMLTNTGNGM